MPLSMTQLGNIFRSFSPHCTAIHTENASDGAKFGPDFGGSIK